MTSPTDFVRDFLAYVETQGIYDEYDKESNKMKTSLGVQNLIQQAKNAIPPRLKPLEAANAMRDLDPEHRDALIARDEEKRIIDMRTQFARKISENGSIRGLLARMLMGDEQAAKDAKILLERNDEVQT